MRLDGLAHRAEDLAQRLILGHRDLLAHRVVEIDTGEIQCRLFDVGALEGGHVEGIGRIRHHVAIVVHGQRDGSDLEQCITGGIETTRLEVDHHWQKATEALCHLRALARLGHQDLQSRHSISCCVVRIADAQGGQL